MIYEDDESERPQTSFKGCHDVVSTFPLFTFSLCQKSHMTTSHAEVLLFNPMTPSCVSLCEKHPQSPSASSCSHLLSIAAPDPEHTGRAAWALVLTVAAKFHRPALNSTTAALCYLSVISHVHLWLTAMEEGSVFVVCVCVCEQNTLQGQTQVWKVREWEKEM